MAVCPYHRKNASTVCTRTATMKVETREEFDKRRCAIKHWCLQAAGYQRHRLHKTVPHEIETILPEAVMDRQVLEMPLPPSKELLLDDDELDMLDGIAAVPAERPALVEAAAAAVVESDPDDSGLDEVEAAAAAIVESDPEDPGPDEVGPNSPSPDDEVGPDSPEDPAPSSSGESSSKSSSYSDSSS